MKKLIYALSIVVIAMSCKEEAPKDYVTLSGIITNQNSDSLRIYSTGFSKKISVKNDGTFSDSLKVTAGKYTLYDGTEAAYLYLKNGYDLQLTLNAKEFDKTLRFKGIGAAPSNYLAEMILLQNDVFDDAPMFALEKSKFDEKINEINTYFKGKFNMIQNLDTAFVTQQNLSIDKFTNYISRRYDGIKTLNLDLPKGSPSPKFVDYENFAGGKTSLDDFKGSYVYIDLWATWCGPCIAQIPFLKELEKEYHDKNITFVSISTDRDSAYETWKKMVVEKELTGVQLYSKRDPIFTSAYKVKGIPRFILIDPSGNIISADAPRPSSNYLKVLFDELNI